MGLLKEVSNEQARAKVGAFGHQGSGKTTTLALLAIGISKTFHNGAPVAMMDTEAGADFLKPLFDAEGVKLLVHKSGAFADMVKVLREAEQMGCCAFIMDSVTHTWRELVESYCAAKARAYRKESYSPQFQDWKDIKSQWAVWTYAFVNSPLHCFVAGRAGYEYEYQENDAGKKELVKGDSKMKAEGEFGYEPSLLIEMEAERHGANSSHHGGMLIHKAHVLKDRARTLNGKSFPFADMNDYKPGDYKKVFEVFRPHFLFLNIEGTQRAISTNTSEELFEETNGDTEARQRAQSRKIAIEEMENLMGVILWPGTSADMKRIKLEVVRALFGVTAWSAVETMPLKKLEDGLWALQEYERAAQTAHPENGAILPLLRECIQKVNRSGYAPGREEEIPRNASHAAPAGNGAATNESAGGPATMAAPKANIPPPEPNKEESWGEPNNLKVPRCTPGDNGKQGSEYKEWLSVAWDGDLYKCFKPELFGALQLCEKMHEPVELELKASGRYKNIVGIKGYELGQDNEYRKPIQREPVTAGYVATDADVPF